MIEAHEEMNQALEQFDWMERALTALRKDVLPRSESWFSLLAERPLDENRRLRAVIERYLDKGPRS
jgi:hypothetical protein